MGRFGAPVISRQGFSSPDIVDSVDAYEQQKAIYRYYLRGMSPDQPHNGASDPRAWAVPNAGGVPRNLLRGRITAWEREKSTIPGAAKPLWRSLNFLYNPNTITHSYGFSLANEAPAFAGGDPTPPLQTDQSVSWELFFNRVYDVMADPHNNTGVMKDISALEYLLGSYDGIAVQAIPVLVVFGVTPSGTPFSYYGWLTDIRVSYEQFTQNMIPTIALVGLTLTRHFLPELQRTQGPGAALAGTVDPATGQTIESSRDIPGAVPIPQSQRQAERVPGSRGIPI